MKIELSSPDCRSVCATFVAATLPVLAAPALAFDYYSGAKTALSINDQGVLSQQGGGPNVPPAAAVCRFFTVAFPPSSSHFYAPRGLGCEGTLTNTNWQYEGDVFYVSLPTVEGVCPGGSQPVYRLYNNGRGGAPNHRFTTSETTRSQMIAEGFVPEEAGPMGVGFCAPQ